MSIHTHIRRANNHCAYGADDEPLKHFSCCYRGKPRIPGGFFFKKATLHDFKDSTQTGEMLYTAAASSSGSN
jgi:hypothetical protein